MTKKKINKKTKTKMMCFKDTTYSIFLTSRELKNIKYGISSKLFHIFHQNLSPKSSHRVFYTWCLVQTNFTKNFCQIFSTITDFPPVRHLA